MEAGRNQAQFCFWCGRTDAALVVGEGEDALELSDSNINPDAR